MNHLMSAHQNNQKIEVDEPGKVTANHHVVALGARQHKVYAYLCLVSQCFACLRRKVREKNALAF